MTLPPEIAGPAGALVVLAFMVMALMRGDLVPGYIYRQERAQREKAETQAERNADSIAQLAQAAAEAHTALRSPSPPQHG